MSSSVPTNPAPLLVNTGLVLTVGAGMEFATLADACRAAPAGATIAVQAGTYVNDFTVVNTALHIVAMGGIVNEVATVPPPNDKGLITVNANLTIQGFTFTGGSDGSPDGNVAGIRLQGGTLAVSYCYFHNMQEGLLADADPTAAVTIDHSEFANNGTGDGYTHNLYVGSVASLTITNSYFHGAVVGHEIKSRAAVTTITNNVIADGPTGSASYDIDIPNGGVARITNNIIEKGPDAANTYAIHYGGETQYAYANNSLTISGNTILNDQGSVATAVLNQSSYNNLTVSAAISNNSIFGFTPAQMAIGAASLAGNTYLAAEPGYSTASPWQSPPIVTLAAGPELLNLTNGSHVVSGGAVKLNINDTGGSNVIHGGTGGVNVVASGGWDTITTHVGAADAITLSARNNVLISAGNDHISVPGYYEDVTVTGHSTITGSSFNTYRLNGTGENLTVSNGGFIFVGAGGSAIANDTGGDFQLQIAAGGHLAIDDLSATPNGGAATTATITGAIASGLIGNSGTVAITTGDTGARVQAGTGTLIVTGGAGADTLCGGAGTAQFTLGSGADRVNFGAGAATVTGGSGADIYSFQSGNDGTATINGFKSGTDSLKFNGFGAGAIASDSMVNGNTVLTLSDGTVITLTNVASTLASGTLTLASAQAGNATLGGGVTGLAMVPAADIAHHAAPILASPVAAAASLPDAPALGISIGSAIASPLDQLGLAHHS
jgi:hypothetical protein